jgi:hypothetical protein
MKADAIPYLRSFPNDGRIRPLSTFFDGSAWYTYIVNGKGEVIPMGFNDLVRGNYLSASPARKDDVEIPLLTFFFQHYPAAETINAFEILFDDLENSLASLHKLDILFRYYDGTSDRTYGKVVATELEYALFNYRSAFDLLNRFTSNVIQRHSKPAKVLPDSFRKVVQKSRDQLYDYGLSKPLCEFYEEKKEMFMLFRALRDDVGHHGHYVAMIMKLEKGFGISGASSIGSTLKKGRIWDLLKPVPKEIGSVKALLSFLSKDLWETVTNYTDALRNSFGNLPAMTAPGFSIYARSDLFTYLRELESNLAAPWQHSEPQQELMANPTKRAS